MKYDYKIDTKLLPNIFVTWASTKGGAFQKRYWLNCKTGKKKETPESWMNYKQESDINIRSWNAPAGTIGLHYRTMKDKNIWVNNGSDVKYAYVKYHKGIDMLEVAAVGVKTTRAEEPHNWEYLGDRFFIDRSKNIVNQDGEEQRTYYVDKTHTAYSKNELLSVLARMNYNDEAINEFKKFIGADYFIKGNGKCFSITHFWHLKEWISSSQKIQGKGKEQQLTDMLVEKPLSNTSGFAEKYPKEVLEDNGFYRREIRNIMYFERLDDGWNVLRQFSRDYCTGKISEVSRVYLNDNGKVRIVAPSKDGWVPSIQLRSGWNSYYKLVNKEEAMEKCPRIKYTLEALSFVEKEKLADALIKALKFPEIEQLLKLGCKKAADIMIREQYSKARVKDHFGGYYNDKEKSILRKVGLTKHQLDYYVSKIENNNRYYDMPIVLSMMRNSLGNDLSYLDYESFKKFLNGFIQIKRNFWRGVNYYTERLRLDNMKFIKNLIRLGEKREEIYGVMHDTVQTYLNLNYGTAPEVNWYFDDCSDVIRMHDALVAMKNEQDAERQAMRDMEAAERRKKEEEKRIKIDKERKQYEYEDDNYIIRLPKDSTEIVSEGSTQHICIGGYTSRHANGDTNLFFLRRKDCPELPFYAIEMNNRKVIMQIHGFGNKWLGNNPEAIPTVVRWLRKNGITCDEKILTCTATGYGRVNNYVPMPVVD